ncbi:MAG: hypothetical protein CMJ48_14885 [Planctomycetaceae bacterium]|nr:hypothetical protein [Planctomycetaceae bacterium]
MKTTFAIAATLVAFSTQLPSAQARPLMSIDDTADQLQHYTAFVSRSVSANFRHIPHYRHLAKDVRELAELAEHIHEVAHHHPERLRHLSDDVEEMHEHLEHIVDVVDHVKDDLYAQSRRSVLIRGRHVRIQFGAGSLSLLQVRQLERALDGVDSMLHELDSQIERAAAHRSHSHGYSSHGYSSHGHSSHGSSRSTYHRSGHIEIGRHRIGGFGFSLRIK